MKDFEALVARCKASVELTVNGHRAVYETAEEYIGKADYVTPEHLAGDAQFEVGLRRLRALVAVYETADLYYHAGGPAEAADLSTALATYHRERGAEDEQQKAPPGGGAGVDGC